MPPFSPSTATTHGLWCSAPFRLRSIMRSRRPCSFFGESPLNGGSRSTDRKGWKRHRLGREEVGRPGLRPCEPASAMWERTSTPPMEAVLKRFTRGELPRRNRPGKGFFPRPARRFRRGVGGCPAISRRSPEFFFPSLAVVLGVSRPRFVPRQAFRRIAPFRSKSTELADRLIRLCMVSGEDDHFLVHVETHSESRDPYR